MTLGASEREQAAAAASTPPALTMNRRRSTVLNSFPPEGRDRDTRDVARPSLSHRDELMVGAFGDVVPGTDQCLELREGHWTLRLDDESRALV